MAQRKQIRLVSMRTQVQSLLAQWVKDLGCRELWRRLQRQLRSAVAVAVVQARSFGSNSTPSLGTSICRGYSPKKTPKKKKKKKYWKKKSR